MRWTVLRNMRWAVGILMLAIASLPSTLLGQFEERPGGAPDAAKQEAIKRVNQAFDELDAEIDKLEKLAETGFETIQQYQAELNQEYRDNDQQLQQAKERGLDSTRIDELALRQKMISLYLWELERLKPEVLSGELGRNDLNMRLHRILSQHRVVRSNPKVMERYRQINQRINEMAHNRNQRVQMRIGPHHRGRDEFYVIDPLRQPQAADSGHTQFESGPIQRLRRPLQRMLKLRWSNVSLLWDQDHWDECFVGKTLEEIADDVRGQLKERNLDLPTDDRRRSRHSASHATNIRLLFQNLSHRANEQVGALGRRGSSGSSHDWQSRFRTDQLMAQMNVRDSDVDLRLDELDGPERWFQVTHSRRKGLFITLRGANHTMLFDQRVDGRVRLLEMYNEEKIAASADSFAELYADYPDLIEVSFFPLLEHFGFLLPPTRFDKQVISRVIQRLPVDDELARSRFRKLLAQLDSPSYEVRNRAAKKLQQEAPMQIDRITNAYKQEGVSLEARTRLKRIIQSYENDAHQLDTFISEMGLAQDIGYLISVLTQLQPGFQQQQIISHLEQLTGKTFGSDVDQWQRWLQRQG